MVRKLQSSDSVLSFGVTPQLRRRVVRRHKKYRGVLLRSFKSPEVAEVFEAYPLKLRRKLLALRTLIFATAESTEGVGEIEETLKWGEPAYLTSQSKSGSTIRIGPKKSDSRQYGIYFNCQTTLVETFRQWFPAEFQFEGNRAIVFEEDDRVPRESLAVCIGTALTYHLNKKSQLR